ncbi:hypothetical protein B566_EDAN015006 [Ephemera danica]|nr:hypothetical protein B566_EDAN002396 [Ephemera danica]KAF4532027.1 hypothetical protein B566_EDAN015006 [Ephemera danica]
MGLKINGKTTHYKAVKHYVRPTIRYKWITHRREVIERENLAAQHDPNGTQILQDGQYDSPGFNAWLHTHSTQIARTNEVCDIIIMKKDPDNPGDMEVKCSKISVERLDTEFDHLKIVCTDRHRGIVKLLRENFSHIEHDYDLWHIVKSFRVKFAALAKQKRYEVLAPWQQPIIRHLWYSASVCNGHADILIETFTSCLKHITGVHEWSDGVYVHRCAHDVTDDTESPQLAILDEDMPAYQALAKIVKNPALLSDLRHAHRNLQTSLVETYHSLRLEYLPKRVAFSWDGSVDRSILAALDNNFNLGREEVGQKLYYSKATKRWVYRTTYSPKSETWRKQLLRETLDINNIPKKNSYEREFNELFGTFYIPQSSVPVPRPTGDDLPVRQSRLQV